MTPSWVLGYNLGSVTPTVLIAANPYEAELCRKALRDVGVPVESTDSIEGAMDRISAGGILVVVIGDGWADADARELLVEVRAHHGQLPIFFFGDRDGDIRDEDAAIRRGASRLFLRPIDPQNIADSIEKLAVEAELAGEISDQIEATRDDGSVELEADYEEADEVAGVDLPPPIPAIPTALTAEVRLPRAGTEVLPGPLPASQTVSQQMSQISDGLVDQPPELELELEPMRLPRADDLDVFAAPQLDVQERQPAPVPSLLRADEAMTDMSLEVEMKALARTPHLFTTAPPVVEPEPMADRADHDRSTIARHVDHRLSEADRRLFPDAAPTPLPRRYDDYADALDDIDLDSLGLDTMPGIPLTSLDAGEARSRVDSPKRASAERQTVRPAEGGAPLPSSGTGDETSTWERLVREAPKPADTGAVTHPRIVFPSLPVDGTLEDDDICQLLCRLTSAGWTGRLELSRGRDVEKSIYFDAGVPVFATSNAPQDRLGDLLFREGKLTREQHGRTRAIEAEHGRRMANVLIDLGMLKMKELFPTLRRQMEEIIHSLFAWESGRFRLQPEQTPAEERLRLAQHPWALFLEGVRRKYGPERLAERVGAQKVSPQPTTNLDQALADAGLSEPEREVAVEIDGERTLADLLRLGGLGRLSETSLYALVWGLHCMGAVTLSESEDPAEVRSASTVVTVGVPGRDRRQTRRMPVVVDGERGQLAEDAVDKERLLAKRAQLDDADYFAILGVDAEAQPHEIERAWERMRQDFAPERFTASLRGEFDATLDDIAATVDEAYHILRDPDVRRAYRDHRPDDQ